MKIETKFIHAGVHPDPSTGAVMTPIYQTSTYAQAAPGNHKGYEYGRTQNPTRTVLENNLAELEGGLGAICFASGLAAMDAILKLLKSGDEIISTNDLYGGSYRQIDKVYGGFGLKGHFIDLEDIDLLERTINERTRLIWIETPTNPMLKILDIRRICDLAKKKGIMVCVDNTFASPYLQQPFALGADLVLHSATKFLGGHSDTVLGAVVCRRQEELDRLRFIQNASGAIPGPMDCFLVLRGIKTLHVRMERACDNAEKIVSFLQEHPLVEHIVFPGQEEHSNHDVAKRQMKRFGAMISFDLKSGRTEEVIRVLSGTRVFTLAESLGGVESLIGHPASMTHASIPREERLRVGLTDTLIRLSIGIEHADDLIADLADALDALV